MVNPDPYTAVCVTVYFFQFRTFVVRVQPLETIARVRAHLLHILYEVGHDDPQFRLRFNGVYLRDAYTIDDYEIMENAILKMVPLSKDNSEVGKLLLVRFQKVAQCIYNTYYMYLH